MNVSSWSIKNPIPAVLLFILLTIVGLMGFSAMKIQNFPDIDLPTVTVTASLPGAAPAQLETEVARKIENSIATLQGIKHIYTKVQDGTVFVTTEFRLEKPTQEAVDDIRDAVSRVRADLPADLRGVFDSAVADATSYANTIANAAVVCRDDAACVYDPNNGAAAAGKLSAFIGQAGPGTWKLCVGDSGVGDLGSIDQVKLVIGQ